MKKVQIDAFGFPYTSEYFRLKRKETYLLKEIDGVYYECFDEKPKRPIHRIDVAGDGSLRVMWAYGSWDEAENLRYVPINETLSVEEEECE